MAKSEGGERVAFSIKAKAGGLAALLSYKRALELTNRQVNGAVRDAQPLVKAFLAQRFAQGRDPYGRRWRTRKHQYAHPTLRRTRKLQRSLRVFKRGLTLVMVYVSPYGGFHQAGSPPQNARRMMVPDGAMGLPPKLVTVYRRVIRKRLIKHLGR